MSGLAWRARGWADIAGEDVASGGALSGLGSGPAGELPAVARRRESGYAEPVIDAHAHLDAAPDVPGVEGWVVPGVDAETDARSRALAEPGRVIVGVGLHPWFLPAMEGLPAALDDLRSRAREQRPCAIGETGLHKGRRGAPRPVQEAAFAAQIELARELELPLILHVVHRHGAALEMLADFACGGLVHDFVGPTELARDWVDAGFCLSVSPRRPSAELLAAIPPERLLLETDDAGPEALPALLQTVAALLGESPEAVAARTAANARRLFPGLA